MLSECLTSSIFRDLGDGFSKGFQNARMSTSLRKIVFSPLGGKCLLCSSSKRSVCSCYSPPGLTGSVGQDRARRQGLDGIEGFLLREGA